MPGHHCQNTSDLDLNTQITLSTSSQWAAEFPASLMAPDCSQEWIILWDAKALCTKHSLCYTGGKLDKLFQSRYPAYQGLRGLYPSPAPLVGICCIHSYLFPACAAGAHSKQQQGSSVELCRCVTEKENMYQRIKDSREATRCLFLQEV